MNNTNVSGPAKTNDIESQIAAFLAKYDPAIGSQLREARTRLRAKFPRGFELVYDNHNALVFAISPSENSSQAFVSVAGYPRWVTLFFLDGTDLHDPRGLLAGQGKQVRSIRLKQPSDISTRDVDALIVQAVRPREAALRSAPKLTTIIKSISARQRSRRPANPSR